MSSPENSKDFMVVRVPNTQHLKYSRLKRWFFTLAVGNVLVFSVLGMMAFTPGGDNLRGQIAAVFATETPTPTETPIPSPTTTPSNTPVPTDTPTHTPSSEPTDAPTATFTLTPSVTPTSTFTATPAPVTVRIMLVGDVMLGRMVASRSVEYDDPIWPFQGTAHLLQQADVTIGNLEVPVIEECEIDEVSMQLCASPSALEGLRYAGFDAVSLANNHTRDYGEDGYEQTVQHVANAGIFPMEKNGNPAFFNVNGVQVGIIADQNFLRDLKLEDILARTRDLTSRSDVRVVFMHWGAEYWTDTTIEQEIHGRKMIENGAHIVAGAHPHYFQRIEVREGGLLFHSLGNFVFDQMWSDATSVSAIADVTLTVHQGQVIAFDYDLIPVWIRDYGQPQVITEDWELQRFCEIYPQPKACPWIDF